ncbi:hypothetical protein HY636_05975, partial [Candidatus Woesearchaeota archaeon]|nr:hypothetical protein [Candidatus Woesearchaeota archaeon]
ILSPTYPDNETWVKRLALIYDTAEGKIYDDFAAVVVDLKGTRRKYYENKISGTEDKVTRKNSEITQLTTRAKSAETSLSQVNTQLAERDKSILGLEQRIKDIESRQSESDKEHRLALENIAYHIWLNLDYNKRKKRVLRGTNKETEEKTEKNNIKNMTDDYLHKYISINFNELACKARGHKGILERGLEKVGTILSAFNCWYIEYRSKKFQEMKDRLSSTEKKLKGITEELEVANKQIKMYQEKYITREEDEANVKRAKYETERIIRQGYDERIGRDLFTERQVADRISAKTEGYKARITPPPLPKDAFKSADQIKDTDSNAITTTQPSIEASTIPSKSALVASQQAEDDSQTVVLPNTPDEASDADSNVQPAPSKTLREIIDEKTRNADETKIKRYITYALFYILDKRKNKETKKGDFDYTSEESGGESYGKGLRETINNLYKLEKKKEKTTKEKRKIVTAKQVKYVDDYIKQESDKWTKDCQDTLRHTMIVGFLSEIYSVMDHNQILEDKKIEEEDKLDEVNPSLKKSIDDYFSQLSTSSQTEELSQSKKISSRKWWLSWQALGLMGCLAIAGIATTINYYNNYNSNDQPAKTENDKEVAPLPAKLPAQLDKESKAEQPVKKDEHTVNDTDKTKQPAQVEKPKLADEHAKKPEEIKPAKDVMNGEQEALHQPNIFAVINNTAQVYTSKFLDKTATEIAKPTTENPVNLAGDTQQPEIISPYSANFKRINDGLNNKGYIITVSGNSSTAKLENRLETRQINVSYDANGITLKGSVSRTIRNENGEKESKFDYNLMFNNNGITVQGGYYQLSTDASHNLWIFECVDNKDCEEPKQRKNEGKAFASFDIIIDNYIGSKMTFELKEDKLELTLESYGDKTINDSATDIKTHVTEEYMRIFGKNITEGIKLAMSILKYVNEPTR